MSHVTHMNESRHTLNESYHCCRFPFCPNTLSHKRTHVHTHVRTPMCTHVCMRACYNQKRTSSNPLLHTHIFGPNIHTHMRTRTRIHTHTHIYARAHTHRYTHICAHTCAYAHGTIKNEPNLIHPYTHIHLAPPYTHIRARARTYTHTHTHIHTHRHTHMYVPAHVYACSLKPKTNLI